MANIQYGAAKMYPEDHDPNASSQDWQAAANKKARFHILSGLLYRMHVMQWLLGNLPARTGGDRRSSPDYAPGELQNNELADTELSDLRQKAFISSMLHAASSRWKRC
ncbi:hypothetical protein QA648_26730 (plasmid) [Rhizobium sp. CB3171]|uniref:hypothetical protein n=2 Tax=Rhizobium TaxID=379 RepID=UPI0024B11523|nr:MULTISPECIES: hypothetical protein [unclassified Rhizobium]MDK4741292.1 hypothetical protein [Rhizobium sp. CNPSo 3464]WFU04384.1 hypothetical protein QA648_26730 [Rhizobium sp. CB3171]